MTLTRVLADSGDPASIIIWSLALVGFLVVLFVGVSLLRRWMSKSTVSIPGNTGFTLSDLRELRRKGQMSDEEFEKARAAIVQAAQKAVAREAAAPKQSNPIAHKAPAEWRPGEEDSER